MKDLTFPQPTCCLALPISLPCFLWKEPNRPRLRPPLGDVGCADGRAVWTEAQLGVLHTAAGQEDQRGQGSEEDMKKI